VCRAGTAVRYANIPASVIGLLARSEVRQERQVPTRDRHPEKQQTPHNGGVVSVRRSTDFGAPKKFKVPARCEDAQPFSSAVLRNPKDGIFQGPL